MGIKSLKIKQQNWKQKLAILLILMSSFVFNLGAAFGLNSYDVVRVGITDNKFQNVLKQNAVIYGTAEMEICDKASRKVIAKVPTDYKVEIVQNEQGLVVTINNQTAMLQDIVIICPQGLLGVEGLLRKGVPALYHGAFEITQNSNHSGFYIINLVEIQEYLKGVVPNEMPVSFGLEALKAQAVAARNYVLTPRTQAYKEFSVVDSVASQVYFGANTEEELATRAVMETDGIVALYDNNLILALYSSTAGGYTESYANAFSDPNTKTFPSHSKPYLIAVPDKSEFKPLENEEDAKDFYEVKVPSFDIESPYYRWSKQWSAAELEDVLKKTIPAQAKTGFIYSYMRNPNDIGSIKDIKVMRRGPSGKIIELEIHTSKGYFIISKELVIRRVFQKNGVSLPSANAVFEKELDRYGNVVSIKVYGGGFGHGVGMSQFGAGYMATKLGQPYYNILRHYYQGINLGTVPVTICGDDVKQTFWAPIGRAQIVITDTTAPKLAVMINGKEHEFNISKPIFNKEYKIDISRYIDDGFNTITFHNPSLGRSVKAYVELVEKYKKLEFSSDDKK